MVETIEIILLLMFLGISAIVQQLMLLRKDIAITNQKTRESIHDHKHDVLDKLNDCIVEIQIKNRL